MPTVWPTFRGWPFFYVRRRAAAAPFGVRRQFSSSGARDAMLSALFQNRCPTPVL